MPEIRFYGSRPATSARSYIQLRNIPALKYLDHVVEVEYLPEGRKLTTNQ